MKRIITSLLLVLCASLSTLAQRVTAEFTDTPLSEALLELERQCPDMCINFVRDDMKEFIVTQSIANLQLKEAIHAVIGDYPVRAVRKKNKFYLSIVPTPPLKIVGEVQDGFLKRPVFDVKVSLNRADSTVILDSLRMINAWDGNKVVFSMYSAEINAQDKEYLVHAEAPGYADVWRKVSVHDQEDGKIDVPTIDMRRVHELKQLDVVATRIKMCWKGDTIVYDATAFQLPDGSMLDDLIRQLEGVTMNEKGEIFVNGRKVDELLLGSRSFMGGNKKVLLENLPYYTVKHVKVYEKQSERSKAAGFDIDPRQYVMDVILKDEYRNGYIGNVEAAGGTGERYLARAFLLGFTDRTRFTLMGNINNVNETMPLGQDGHWTPEQMPTARTTTRYAAMDIDYAGEKFDNQLWTGFTSSTTNQEMRQDREQFLQGSTPRSLTHSFSHNGTRNWRVSNYFNLKKPSINIHVRFDHSTRNGSFNSSFDQWEDSLVASMRSVGMSEGKAWSVNAEANGLAVARKKHGISLDYNVKWQLSNDENQQASRYRTEQFVASASQSLRHNTNDRLNRNGQFAAQLKYQMSLGKGWESGIKDRFEHHTQHSRDNLFHPDTLLMPSQIDALATLTDMHNSYDSRRTYNSNDIVLSLEKRVREEIFTNVYVSRPVWTFQIGLPYVQDELTYQRGVLDTLVHRNRMESWAEASYRAAWKERKQDLTVTLHHDRNDSHDLIHSLVNYHDDSQPLVVRLGNPDLHGNSRTHMSVGFSDRTGSRNRLYSMEVGATYHHSSVAESVIFNRQTGVYTYQPVNVNGNYKVNGRFNYTRNIDEKGHWLWSTIALAGYHHLLDHSMMEGETESHLGAVNTFNIHDMTYIMYDYNQLNVRATGDIEWHRSHGRLYDFASLSAIDFHYGLDARYTLPKLKTTLSVDATMYSRRGYGSSDLNTDDFVLNASLSQPFLKGKLIARIEAFDLLRQLSNTQYAVNAQGRTITWYRSLPHYAMLHLVYHWNKNPKKH